MVSRYVSVVPPYKVVVGERPFYNAEDDAWFDRMVMFTLDNDLYAASENGLFKYDNGVDRTLRYGFTTDGAFGLIDFPERETYERKVHE